MSHSITPLDPRLRASFEAELAAANRHPELRPRLRRESAALLPCFARYHDYLTRLPRRARRSLQRQWRRSLAGLALLLALGQAPALAATIAVDGTTCTLVDAITAANSDTIAGGCSAGSGPDILELVAGSTHTLTAVNNSTPYGPTALPVIGTEITIEGHGSTITRSSADAFRIFAVNSSGNLTLNECTVSGGLATRGSFPADAGGGVLNYRGTATLTDSTVSGNSAFRGGGVSEVDPNFWTGA